MKRLSLWAAVGLLLMACGLRTAWADALPLYQFTAPDGLRPLSALVRGADGDFYGTTSSGGSGGDGTVFKVTPGGTLTTLVNFSGPNGAAPEAALVQGSDGNFYGTTYGGGGGGDGTVFKVTPGGTLTTLLSFNGTDGAFPEAGLVQGADGNFYGTTYGGGSGKSGSAGTVFKVTPGGTLTTLVNFNGPDGLYPEAALVLGADGNFYGTTGGGGSGSNGVYGSGDGTVFQVTPGGTLTTLVNFNGPDGSDPEAALVQGADGNFYGTAYNGGVGGGTIFRLDASFATTVTVANVSGAAGQTVTLSATLMGGGGAALSGKTLTFKVDGAVVGTAVTDGSGTAALPYAVPAGDALGSSHTITVSFAGDATYLPGTGTGTLKVKSATALAVPDVSGTRGTSVTLTATLTAGGSGLPSKTVTFRVDGAAVGTAVTGAGGVATFSYAIPARDSLGSHGIGAAFAGDAGDAPCVGKGTLTVN